MISLSMQSIALPFTLLTSIFTLPIFALGKASITLISKVYLSLLVIVLSFLNSIFSISIFSTLTMLTFLLSIISKNFIVKQTIIILQPFLKVIFLYFIIIATFIFLFFIIFSIIFITTIVFLQFTTALSFAFISLLFVEAYMYSLEYCQESLIIFSSMGAAFQLIKMYFALPKAAV